MAMILISGIAIVYGAGLVWYCKTAFLFSESIMENIRYGRLNATDDDVLEKAAQMANADGFIRNLPNGYLQFILKWR